MRACGRAPARRCDRWRALPAGGTWVQMPEKHRRLIEVFKVSCAVSNLLPGAGGRPMFVFLLIVRCKFVGLGLAWKIDVFLLVIANVFS